MQFDRHQGIRSNSDRLEGRLNPGFQLFAPEWTLLTLSQSIRATTSLPGRGRTCCGGGLCGARSLHYQQTWPTPLFLNLIEPDESFSLMEKARQRWKPELKASSKKGKPSFKGKDSALQRTRRKKIFPSRRQIKNLYSYLIQKFTVVHFTG